MPIAKKYFLFHGLNTKKAGLKRVRIAKKIHSSLLSLFYEHGEIALESPHSEKCPRIVQVWPEMCEQPSGWI